MSSSKHSEQVTSGMSRAAKKRRIEKDKQLNKKVQNSTDKCAETLSKSLETIRHYSIFAPPTTDIILPEISSKKNENKPYTLRDALETKDGVDFDANTRAATVLSLLLQPVYRTNFYKDYWQKKPIHCRRDTPLNVKSFYSSKTFDKTLRQHVLESPSEVILGKYVESSQVYFNENKNEENDSEENFTLTSTDIDAATGNGFSYRLQCPQKYFDGLWKLLSSLEFEFGNAILCHITVSPAGCQAFGPMMTSGDSIFVQLEGSISVKAYSPHDASNVDNSESTFSWPPPVDGQNVVLDASLLRANIKSAINSTLHFGDTLYIPKGWVVECCAETCNARSVTLEVVTNHHFGGLDLVEILLPQAMAAMERKGMSGTNNATVACQSLPRAFLEFMGVSRSENDSDVRRKEFNNYFTGVMNAVVERAMGILDPAADQIAKNFISSRLPIPVTDEEEAKLYSPDVSVVYPYSKLRMLRPGIARAVVEDGMIVVYHCMDNSRMIHEFPLNPLEFDLDDGPAIEILLDAYPTPVVVMDLPHPSEELEDKVSIAQALYREGFLLRVEEEDVQNENDDDSDDPF